MQHGQNLIGFRPEEVVGERWKRYLAGSLPPVKRDPGIARILREGRCIAVRPLDSAALDPFGEFLGACPEKRGHCAS